MKTFVSAIFTRVVVRAMHGFCTLYFIFQFVERANRKMCNEGVSLNELGMKNLYLALFVKREKRSRIGVINSFVGFAREEK